MTSLMSFIQRHYTFNTHHTYRQTCHNCGENACKKLMVVENRGTRMRFSLNKDIVVQCMMVILAERTEILQVIR